MIEQNNFLTLFLMQINKKIVSFFFLSFFLLSSDVNANDKLINLLNKGRKIVFIRHALAPGTGDPKNFNIKNCSSQRNLNNKGINQSKKIGFFFFKNKIPIDKVLSSEWCRCKDTAKFAFQKYETYSALNSFYDTKFRKNKKKQINDLKDYIDKWNGKKNLILVTHFVIISELLDVTSSSGEIIIVDKKFNIIGNLTINN